MLTAEECRAKAVEAEALARLVSLETDRKRLLDMAKAWRDRAIAAEADAAKAADAKTPDVRRRK